MYSPVGFGEGTSNVAYAVAVASTSSVGAGVISRMTGAVGRGVVDCGGAGSVHAGNHAARIRIRTMRIIRCPVYWQILVNQSAITDG